MPLPIKSHKIIDGHELKHCCRCGEWKPLSAFNKNKTRWDGLAHICTPCHVEVLREYRERHPGITGEWAKKNPERANANAQRYRAEHPEWWKAWNDQNNSKPHNRIRHRISAGMRYALRGNKRGKHWETLVGYTLEDLQKHLSRTMPNGYTWADLDKLHIDHIIPITAFNIEDENSLDFHRCWSLKNLRLLPAKENQMKLNHLHKPFQPSLSIGVH